MTPVDVLAAAESIAPCFEIVDTVADNASCGVFAVGPARVDPRGLDLAGLRVTVTKNGAPLSDGYGVAVQGSPLAAVTWLANTLAHYGVALNAGDIILSGSLVPLEPARAEDLFGMELHDIGPATAQFV